MLHGDDELHYLMRVLRNTFLTSRRTAGRRPVTVATLDKPTEIPNQTDECGKERDLRGTVATHVLEFRTATLRVGQRREQPPLWSLVRVRQVSNEIGPRMR